ncbi:MAG: GtrA family protein [Clostridia bacterium]|nr:GtrA family protein [Clostridia bacterium]
MEKIKSLYLKHKEIITYLVFGVLTTLVNFVSFGFFEFAWGNDTNSYLYNNALAWLIAVIFAYVTNKIFVFESSDWGKNTVVKELAEFFGARIFSFALEEAGLWLFVDILHFGEMSYTVFSINLTGELIAKLILAVVVIILNYFFSKFIIFKKAN